MVFYKLINRINKNLYLTFYIGYAFCNSHHNKSRNMKKEVGVLLAGGVGLLAVLSIIGIKKILDRKDKKYNDSYSDYHRHFDNRNAEDDYHGIEFYALK